MRQHVNPLSSFFQLPLELPPPEELFRVPDQPIHLDIGCARGRCLLGLARQLIPDLPVAGAFCNGEIGPVGGTTHLHGYTACWGLLRQDPDSSSGSGSDNLG